jgi:hypothetical protein
MSRLRVSKLNSDTAVDPEGYIRFVDECILKPANFDKFIKADDFERAGLVQQFACRHPNDPSIELCQVRQKPSGGGSAEPIDETNCLVTLNEDWQKKSSASKHNISLPRKWLKKDETPNIDYLNKYVEIIAKLAIGEQAYTDADKSAGDPVSAGKFLFGLMLLTRCR